MRKHLFYLSKDGMLAYEWQAGQLSAARTFANDGTGMAGFAAYLARRPDLPASLVADVVEEDFQCQTVPHVGGRSGRALLARRLGQAYRDTPYRHAAIQGRDSVGRRDNRVLFNALTNPAGLQPWILLLEQQQVALAGLYSSALLGATLLQRLAPAHEHQLLVTQQPGGLRQSFFHHGLLQFSRLTPAVDGAGAGLATEIARTRQFLSSTRGLERGDVLHAMLLVPAAQMAALAACCPDDSGLVHHFHAIESAAARLGVTGAAPPAECLLLSLLARQAAPSHYPLGRQAHFYRLWQARLCLNAGSAALLVCGLLWLGANLWRIHAASGATADLAQETRAIEQRYGAALASLPASAAKPANMRAAVLIERLVATQGALPAPLLAILSRALDRLPQIRLNQLDWQLALPRPVLPGRVAQQQQGAGAALSSLLVGVPGVVPQSLRVEAEVQADPQDARAAADSMRQFIAELGRDPKLLVEIEQTTLDLRPNVKLAGQAGSERRDANARFSLILVWTP